MPHDRWTLWSVLDYLRNQKRRRRAWERYFR